MLNLQHLDHISSLHVSLNVFSSLSLRGKIGLFINSSLPYPLGFYAVNVHRLAVSNAFVGQMADKSGRARISQAAKKS